MKDRWTPDENVISNVKYHLGWCTMFRRPLLKGAIRARLLDLVSQKAKELGCGVEECVIDPDHVEIIVSSPSTHSAHYLVQQFKSYTSKILRAEFKEMKTKVPSPWTRAYYCGSVGRSSREGLADFISSQMTRSDYMAAEGQITLPFKVNTTRVSTLDKKDSSRAAI